MRVVAAVRLYQAGGDSENWKQPNGIGRPKFAGTGPNLFLIEPEIFSHQQNIAAERVVDILLDADGGA